MGSVLKHLTHNTYSMVCIRCLTTGELVQLLFLLEVLPKPWVESLTVTCNEDILPNGNTNIKSSQTLPLRLCLHLLRRLQKKL